MPSARQTTLRLSDTTDWTATELISAGSTRRGLGPRVADRFLERLTNTGRVDLARALEVTPVKRRGAVPIRLEATTEAVSADRGLPPPACANLLDLVEMVPVVGDSPFVVGAEFVADGLSWIANHVLGALPGLAAMDTKSDAIAKLQN